MYHCSGMIRTVVLLLIAYFGVNVSSDGDCLLNALEILRTATANSGIPNETPLILNGGKLGGKADHNGIVQERKTYTSTLHILLGRNPSDGIVDEPHTTPATFDYTSTVQILRGTNPSNGIVDEPQTTPSTFDVRIGDTIQDSPPNNILSFEKLYLKLKAHYEQKLQKLQIENDLLKSLYSTSSNSNAIHPIETICTCNVTEGSTTPTNNDCSDSQTNILPDKAQDIQRQLSNITGNIRSSESNIDIRSSESNIECNYGRDAELDVGERPVDWKQLPGAAVEISAKGRELWVINSAQNIYRWDGSNTWEHMPGAAVRVGSSPDGWTWVVNKNDNIYRWNVDKKNWDLMPGALVQISAMSKDRALGVSRGHGIYLWSNNAWTKLTGAAAWVGIGDGDERWVINSAQAIFRWNHQTNSWNQMPGAAINVDVQNPSRVIVTNASNQMFIWKNNNWQMLNGAGTRSSINGCHYYTVNSAEQIFIGN